MSRGLNLNRGSNPLNSASGFFNSPTVMKNFLRKGGGLIILEETIYPCVCISGLLDRQALKTAFLPRIKKVKFKSYILMK